MSASSRLIERGERSERVERILTVENLKTYFRTPEGLVKAVDEVSFHLDRGEVLALVGSRAVARA